MMRVVVFQRGKRGLQKIEGIKKHAMGVEIAAIFTVPEALPEIIDEPEDYIAGDFEAELVLDYLYHPDLSEFLVEIAKGKGVPVIAPGRRIAGAITPPTCCGLGEVDEAGEYARRFGTPELEVEVREGKVANVRVKKGAPCGATWVAAEKVVGLPLKEAGHRFALEVQFICRGAAGYEIAQGKKAPLHFAGDVHLTAFKRAVDRE